MAPNLRKSSMPFGRLAALPALLLALAIGQSAGAMTRAELYEAAAPLSDRSEGAQAAAFQAAMRMVLVRVTGRRSAEDDPAFAPLVSNARRYVQQYRATADNQLSVSFDGAALERWLAQNGQPLWGHERPTTAVWLLVQAGPQAGTVTTASDTSELKSAIDAEAKLRGLPLWWPTAADLQRNHLEGAGLAASPSGTLAAIAKKQGADGTLIGKASGNTGSANVRWTHLFQDRSSDFSGPIEGIDRAADLYAELFAASGNLAAVDIEVSGVDDLQDYAGVQTYLESLSAISHVSVVGLSGDTVRFRLATRGGNESLQRTLTLNGRLAPQSAGEGGVARFQLRR